MFVIILGFFWYVFAFVLTIYIYKACKLALLPLSDVYVWVCVYVVQIVWPISVISNEPNWNVLN